MSVYPHRPGCGCPDCNPPRGEQVTPRRTAQEANDYWSRLYADAEATR
jgi:hypothetical protein